MPRVVTALLEHGGSCLEGRGDRVDRRGGIRSVGEGAHQQLSQRARAGEAAADADRRAVETFAEALAGSGRPFVIASGILGLSTRVGTEHDGHDPASAVAALPSGPRTRWATSELVLSLAERGVRSSIVRLAPTNHGEGDHGFVAALVGIARDKGVSGYIGEGSNRWTAVHRLNSAHLFRLAVERAPAGSTLHAVADEGVPIRDIAAVIGRHLDLPVVSIAPEDAGDHFAWLAGFLATDSPASSALTRELVGWQPTQCGLIEDLDQGHYFDHRAGDRHHRGGGA